MPMATGLTEHVRERGSHARAAILVAVLLLCACATYHGRSAEIKRSLAESDYQETLERIERIDRGTSELLYLYEKGLVLHYENQFAASNEAFERAELLLEELYTKSVSRELAALAITDNITKYRGQTYEAVLVNYYKILNYLYMGDVDGALVECRRVNRKLEFLMDREDVFFADDPFIQFLTGMVYRSASEIGDADVSFRVAVAGYDSLAADYGIEFPLWLRCDAVRAARMLGDAVFDTAAVNCPEERLPGHGSLNLFLECGYVAHKEERKVILPVFKDDDTSDIDAFAPVLAERDGVTVASYRTDKKLDYVLKIAMPVLIPTPVPWEYAVVTAVPSTPPRADPSAEPSKRPVDPETSRAGVVENVDAYATASFEEGYGKILVRTIVRALSKYGAKQAASKENEGLGWLVNWFGTATETADTRSWSTLPEKILMTRLVLPEGDYDLLVDLYDGAGRRVEDLRISGVRVEGGRTTFLNHRIF
jgi:tetratricopeptide (TPR) repeat protein